MIIYGLKCFVLDFKIKFAPYRDQLHFARVFLFIKLTMNAYAIIFFNLISSFVICICQRNIFDVHVPENDEGKHY